MEKRQVHITIPSKLDHVPLVGNLVRALCASLSLSPKEIFNIELCIVEAVNNCIIHAYRSRADNEVEVVTILSARCITFDVIDSGIAMQNEQFENKNNSQMTFDKNKVTSIPESGRGLVIIKKIMDNVSYKSDQGKNHLTMNKHLTKG